jgi:hypothetical protein
MDRTQPHVILGLAGLHRKAGNLETDAELLWRIEIPKETSGHDIARAHIALQKFARLLHERPDDFKAMLNAVSQNRLGEATKVARQLGIRPLGADDPGDGGAPPGGTSGGDPGGGDDPDPGEGDDDHIAGAVGLLILAAGVAVDLWAMLE